MKLSKPHLTYDSPHRRTSDAAELMTRVKDCEDRLDDHDRKHTQYDQALGLGRQKTGDEEMEPDDETDPDESKPKTSKSLNPGKTYGTKDSALISRINSMNRRHYKRAS